MSYQRQQSTIMTPFRIVLDGETDAGPGPIETHTVSAGCDGFTTEIGDRKDDEEVMEPPPTVSTTVVSIAIGDAVMVVVLSKLCVTVLVTVWTGFAAAVVPPSTGTTEYGTRL
ncbi:hypothetical protein MMC30_001957 [Trapelia coarctata]|nr:hypothetical protein [Trapelia coarctata]